MRAARRSDAAALHVLQQAAMRQYAVRAGLDPDHAPLESLAETAEDIAAAIAQTTVLIACRPQSPLVPLASLRLSPAQGQPEPVSEAAGCYWLTRFVVDPALQSQGVGRRLFAAAVDYVAAAGGRCIDLHTALSNADTTAFYQGLGFRLVETSDARGYARGRFRYELTRPHDRHGD